MTKAAASRQATETGGLPNLKSEYTFHVHNNRTLEPLDGGSLSIPQDSPNQTGGAAINNASVADPSNEAGPYTVDGYLDSTAQIVFTLMIGNDAYSLRGHVAPDGMSMGGEIFSSAPLTPQAPEGTWSAQAGGGGGDCK
ncbi:MAG TPA: hypothetical protein VN256_13335 [Pyrinomonadaceae bacterium]|nr:hypothetical protein [Pyrinomonadaceae bacterium]